MTEQADSSAAAEHITDDGRLMFAFAHDLRTHLRTVVTRLQLALSSASEKLLVEDQAWLQEAAKAAADIDCLLNAMVAYCGVRADPTEVSLSLLLRGLMFESKATLAAAGAEVEVMNQLDEDYLEVPVPVALAGVLKELLANACKFRDKARPLRICIGTRMVEDTLEITVSDNGLGVAPDDLEQIFIPFHRLHSRAEFPGCGLGLATCRRIATAWGGTVGAKVRPEGGLTARVAVPASWNRKK